ncbi:hypothetical protein [Microbacterium sp.]|uniref:hypothetical protein n=1 Tax=Microbacterium sp. TaxID=51671 RepID=UPI002735DA26|nr:hypothetical protein [Microbacterium sp.]MDP3951415.1 hypothetical protein [Microbacterium sp.]
MIGRLPLPTRGATTTPALSLFLVMVIAALSYLGVAAPALLADGRTATIQRAVASLPDLSRWPSATTPGLPAFGATSEAAHGIWGTTLAAVEQKRQEQPEPLRSLLGTPRVTVMVDPLPTDVEDVDRVAPVPRNRVGLVSDAGLIDRAELVEGRLPELTDPADGIEILLTESVAEQLGWQAGTERRWDDTTLTLTGIVAPSGRDDGDWVFISGSAEPLVEVDASGNRTLIAAAFIHVDEAAVMVDRVSDMKITAWMPFDAAAIDASTAEKAAAQLRQLAADPADIPMYDTTFYNRGLPFSSSLPQAIGAGVLRADAMTDVVSVASVGPIAVALVVLAFVSRLIAVRRVVPTRMLRARGASTARLIAMLGGEGAALGVLGAVVGAGVAVAWPGRAEIGVLLVPAVLAAVPAIVVPWGALTDAERHGRRDFGETSREGVGRAALDMLILVVTAVLVFLLLARGGSGGADPLLLALPILLGASGSILTLRLLPSLLRLAERRGRRGTSLAALLGPATARRDPVMRTAPVLGVVIGLGVAAFSVAFGATVSDGIARSAAISVGADVRVEAPYISGAGAERVAELDGVASLAALRGDTTVDASSGAQTARAQVYTIDRGEILAVQHDATTALPLPAALAERAEGAVPVVISERLLERLDMDDLEEQGLDLAGIPVHVVGTAPSQVPFGAAELWVIVDAANAAAIAPQGTGLSQLYLSVESDADPEDVGAAAVAALGGDATFETPKRVAAVYEEDPAFSIVQGTLLAASAIVAALLAVGVIATLVLGAPTRARTLVILRALGHPHSASGRLVTWEVAPALLLALPFGVGAGMAMTWLVIPQLDLRGFVGGAVQPSVVLGGAWQLLVVAGFIFVTAIAVVAATVLASRLGAVNEIRADDESTQ